MRIPLDDAFKIVANTDELTMLEMSNGWVMQVLNGVIPHLPEDAEEAHEMVDDFDEALAKFRRLRSLADSYVKELEKYEGDK